MAFITISYQWPTGHSTLPAGTPLDAEGRVANNSTAIGLVAETVQLPNKQVTVLTSGTWNEDVNRANGIPLTTACKRALTGIDFVNPSRELPVPTAADAGKVVTVGPNGDTYTLGVGGGGGGAALDFQVLLSHTEDSDDSDWTTYALSFTGDLAAICRKQIAGEAPHGVVFLKYTIDSPEQVLPAYSMVPVAIDVASEADVEAGEAWMDLTVLRTDGKRYVISIYAVDGQTVHEVMPYRGIENDENVREVSIGIHEGISPSPPTVYFYAKNAYGIPMPDITASTGFIHANSHLKLINPVKPVFVQVHGADGVIRSDYLLKVDTNHIYVNHPTGAAGKSFTITRSGANITITRND